MVQEAIHLILIHCLMLHFQAFKQEFEVMRAIIKVLNFDLKVFVFQNDLFLALIQVIIYHLFLNFWLQIPIKIFHNDFLMCMKLKYKNQAISILSQLLSIIYQKILFKLLLQNKLLYKTCKIQVLYLQFEDFLMVLNSFLTNNLINLYKIGLFLRLRSYFIVEFY